MPARCVHMVATAARVVVGADSLDAVLEVTLVTMCQHCGQGRSAGSWSLFRSRRTLAGHQPAR